MITNQNIAKLRGMILDKGVPHIDKNGDEYYTYTLFVPRESKAHDEINVTIPNRVCNHYDLYVGLNIIIEGEYRSYNVDRGNESGRSHLFLSVFAKKIIRLEDEESDYEKEKALKNNQYIQLTGKICKEPIFRITPSGRYITELLISIEREKKKSVKRYDIIPCICWGNNAIRAKEYGKWDIISINGRIQSRKYYKKINEDKVEMTAYEVSISKMKNLSKEEQDI